MRKVAVLLAAWLRMLRRRHFEHVHVELLEQEAGLATARRPRA
jgi:hypothetical protein